MIAKFRALYAKMSKRERRVLHAAAVLISLVAADQMVIGQVQQRFTSLDRAVRDEEAAIRQSTAVLLQKEQIRRQSKEYAAFAIAARNPEEEMTALLREIEGLAQGSSVSLLYVKPVNTKDEQGAKKFFAALECEGSMDQVADFYYAIETSPKLLRIEKYTIQPKSRDSSIARCVVTVSKTAFS